MSINYAWVETGHPNCRRPDKVIDARHNRLANLFSPLS